MMGTVIKSVTSDTCIFLTVEAIYKDSMSFESYKGQTRLAIWYSELACAYYALEQCLRFLHVIIIKRKIGLCGGLAEVSGTPPYKMVCGIVRLLFALPQTSTLMYRPEAWSKTILMFTWTIY